MRKAAKEETLSVDSALQYLNTDLLENAGAQLLKDYNMTLPVSRKTAWFWMRQCEAVAGKFQQSYYNDHHQSEAVLKDKLERYIPEMDRDELRQPLWVQMSAGAYATLRAASKREGEEAALARGYWYDPDTLVEMQAGDPTAMVEMHVDSSDSFDSFRAQHPMGGDFSVRWTSAFTTGGRHASPPPPLLPSPGLDTLADVETVPDVAVADQPAAAPLSKSQITQAKLAVLKGWCAERGLPQTGTRPVLQASLRLAYGHAGAARDAVPTIAEGADGNAEPQAYNVDQVLNMRFDEHGARCFQVSWEGYDEITWEPESNLDGCLEKLGSFFSDPKHQAPRCRHGHRKGKLRRLAV